MMSPNTPFNWTQFAAQATAEGLLAFSNTISAAPDTLTEGSLKEQIAILEQRYQQSLSYAKRDGANAEQHLLIAVRSWSSEQALHVLRAKLAGKTPVDFYEAFKGSLQHQVICLQSDISQAWEQEARQRAEAKLQEAKRQAAAEAQKEADRIRSVQQEFGRANSYVVQLNDALLAGERQRQHSFESAQQEIQRWADRYGESVRMREANLVEREKLLQTRGRDEQEHAHAMHTLMRHTEQASVIDSAVRIGGRTLSCLFWLCVGGLVVFFGLFLALYLAFPHH